MTCRAYTLSFLVPLLLAAGCAGIVGDGGSCYSNDFCALPEPAPIMWTGAAPGVYAARVNNPPGVSLLDMAGACPATAGLEALGHAPFPLVPEEIEAVTRGGETLLRFPLEKDERIYGFGLNFKTLDQRGRILRLHVDHYGGKDNGRSHAPVPFYLSSRGYGVLVDTARYVTVYAGTAVRADSANPPEVRDRNTDRNWSARPASDGVEIVVPGEGVRVLLFCGPALLDVIRRYNLYCGGGCLPPLWGLGFWHRVPTLYSDEDAAREVDAFAAHGFPLDVIGLEPGWQSRSYPCTYEWDEDRFGRPDEFVAEMNDKGVRVNLWINPYVSPEASVFDGLKPLSGTHTVWCGIVPDTTLPAARRIITDHFEKEHLDIGVSGYKIDECDGYDVWLWPDSATFPSGLTGEEMRQTYALQLQRMMNDMFRTRNSRTYGLVRASNAGAAGFPFAIYSDAYSHREFIAALCSASLCGVLWTPEVRSSATGEEWLRRMQAVCFSPMAMINAWSDGTKPWSFPEVEDAVRDVALLRMRLIPCLYTAFARYRFEGIPPFRAMILEEGFPPPGEKGSVTDQFMAGESLLVAPLFAGETSRRVIFPEGKWYDFYTGKLAGEGGAITVSPGLDRIPLFVKDGGIIPLAPAQRQVPRPGSAVPIEVRHYGEAEGSFLLYDDDGETFDFEKGVCNWRELSVRRTADGKLVGVAVKPVEGMPCTWGETTWRFMSRD
jgi:alpha-glucosidase (family GH31 glycosyl hydrolase)